MIQGFLNIDFLLSLSFKGVVRRNAIQIVEWSDLIEKEQHHCLGLFFALLNMALSL